MANGGSAKRIRGIPLVVCKRLTRVLPIVLDVASRSPGRGTEFRVLGPLEAWVDQKRQQLGGPRQERVLAVLLLEANRVVPLYRLVDAAWAEEPPTTAPHQVRKMVADLRRRLPAPGTTIVTDGPGYRMVVTDEQLDLRMFELRLARAREAEAAGLVSNAVTQLQVALDLWRGPALAGLDGPVIRPAADTLDERRMGALEHLMDLRLSLGESRDLVGDLRGLLAEHPLREGLRGQLMLALYRAGRQADALSVYEDGRRLLADELGIDPGPELIRRHEEILRADPELDLPRPGPEHPALSVGVGTPAVSTPGTPPPSTLPYDLSDFTGRADELDALVGVVEKGSDRTPTVITVDGMAGVGKTTLAVHAAHQLAERFPDGQLFVDLHGFTPGRTPVDPAEALSTLLAALGVPGDQVPIDVVARSAAWRVQAAGRRLLVLLDNAANTAQVRPLLPGAGGCLVLVTSRTRLGLDGAVPLSVVLPTEHDALDLVGRLLGQDRLAGEPAEVAELIEACGRLPLAMRIAATRLNNRPQWTVSYLVARLRREERRLGELALDDRSVEAAVGLSYRGLNEEQQRMFRLLGLHPGTDFDPYAAAAMAGIDRESAEFLLEDLLDTRLLIQRQLGRYTFHDLLRSYAQGAVRADPDTEETAAAVRRMADYYLAAADAAADLIQPGRFRMELPTAPPRELPVFTDRAQAMAWFDAERLTLLAVARYAATNGLDQHASHFPRAIAMYLLLRGQIQDEMALLEAGVTAAHRLGDRGSEMRTLFIVVIALWHVGRFRDAQERANQGLTIATEISDRRGEAVCLSRIGLLYTELGQYVESLEFNGRALEIHRETNDRQEQRTTLNSISFALAALGRYQEALEAASQAVSIERELGGASYGAAGLVNQAIAQYGMGDLDGALATLEEAGGLARQVGSVGIEAEVAAHVAEVYRRLGRYEDAYRSGRRALDIVWAIQRPTITAAVENILGAVHRDRGEPEQALERHRRAADLAERTELRIELARALEGIGHALGALGDKDAAREHWQQALELYEQMRVPEADHLRATLG
jgi:DNA-binding SARP family transcriptional activator/tetratricopeptide (TPR) repeat protein